MDKTIASTNNLAIFGIKTGITEIEAYRYGSEIPFQVIKLNIIQRNRIKKIILDEDELILGIGNRKKLNFEYFPIDADNVSNVTWMSSNKKIAEINSEGLLICKASGKCKIFVRRKMFRQCVRAKYIRIWKILVLHCRMEKTRNCN